MEELGLIDIIHRSLRNNSDDVKPLIKYLDIEESILNYDATDARNVAKTIADQLRKMGSNDIATFFRDGDGVIYEEVVLDVGNKLKTKVKKTNPAHKNEELILLKLFEDSLERMSDDEKREVLRSIGIKENHIPYGAFTTAAIQAILKQYGGFYIYRITVIVANMVSKALLGSSLTFATNAAITRTVGTLLGPIGWLATGLWLLVDIAGPAYRKTVPAVIHIALLRMILKNKIIIGVVGDGSSGKDALLSSVFKITSDINPVAGSTDKALSYFINKQGTSEIVNYPGFNDYRKSVDKHTDDYLFHTDVFILVVDINRGISGTDTKILEKLEFFKKPILICLNKRDLVRNDTDLAKLESAAKERLPNYQIIKTSFDPDPRLSNSRIGCEDVYDWVKKKVYEAGKNIDEENFPKYEP